MQRVYWHASLACITECGVKSAKVDLTRHPSLAEGSAAQVSVCAAAGGPDSFKDQMFFIQKPGCQEKK